MNIKVLVSGCSQCQKMYDMVKRAVEKSDKEITVEKIEDMNQIMSYHIMTTPAVVIDEKIVMTGHHSEQEIATLINSL